MNLKQFLIKQFNLLISDRKDSMAMLNFLLTNKTVAYSESKNMFFIRKNTVLHTITYNVATDEFTYDNFTGLAATELLTLLRTK